MSEQVTWSGRLLAVGRSLALLGIPAAQVAVIAVVPLTRWGWYGAATFPFVMMFAASSRGLAVLARRLAGRWCGNPIGSAYVPKFPLRRTETGFWWTGHDYHRVRSLAWYSELFNRVYKDPQTWRDLAWFAVNPLVGGLLAALPVALFGGGLLGLTLPWTQPVASQVWHPVGSVDALLGVPVGLALVVLGLLAAPGLLRWHGRWTGVLLAPPPSQVLARRVERLTVTRAEATDAHEAEVRRIERDLHDGAQARLVAVGLTLGVAEGLVDTDPDAAKALLARAREASAEALQELRDLVRGILPPVLAERGLGDAVRALALDCPLDVEVSTDLAGRAPAPVESAAYFAVAELLANAVKHAQATRVRVDLTRTAGLLHITVADDGRGGADPTRGGGLGGLSRRLGTFDGTLTVDSPPGGPTEVRAHLPVPPLDVT